MGGVGREAEGGRGRGEVEGGCLPAGLEVTERVRETLRATFRQGCLPAGMG